jgi:hypothetical protein
MYQSEIEIYYFNAWVLKLLHQNAWREKKTGKRELMTVSKKRTLLQDWYKYVLPNSAVKVNRQSIHCSRKSKETLSSHLYLNTLHGTTCTLLCI